ncbi:SUMF1/EgtB/PvdO family nonheme iron enzyme [Stenotrophomonas maltophilia]|uniref:SUMF1/EgtB/PvdO family nonheme iron enzyme n=1 Tax=Stenotrophomonas maltophilia TaxID=40324 RepID=A0AAI9C3Z1_STEMA|nr:SUMF1/EgtB/PvdO family nonheme iron enzyme [Stenotrophomonas maltophilia]
MKWQDAMDFCEWAGRGPGRKRTLPTEAQWELATWSGRKMVVYPADRGVANASRREPPPHRRKKTPPHFVQKRSPSWNWPT